MVRFKAVIQKMNKKGGWTFIEIPGKIAMKITDDRRSFRVKGRLDKFAISGVTVLPLSNGNFMIPLNAKLRKGTGKSDGDMLIVEIEKDKVPYALNSDLMNCLADEPEAMKIFLAMKRSHQNYYSKWIDGAKGAETRARRIALTISSLLEGIDFGTMLRTAGKMSPSRSGRFS